MANGQFERGNQIARKYTKDEALRILQDIHNLLRANPDMFYLGQACNALPGLYIQLPGYLLTNYGHHDDIATEALHIASILETRLAVGAATGKLKEATAIFLMKARHGMSEHQGQPMEPVKGAQTIDLDAQDPEYLLEMRQLREKYEQKNAGTT